MIDQQKGFSLLEILIASALGSLLLTLTLASIVQSYHNFMATEVKQHLQADAQFAMQKLSDHIIQAGYLDDLKQTKLIYWGPCGTANHCTQDNASDQIAIMHDPIDDRDCTNQSKNISPADIIANVFWIQINSNGHYSLYCRGFNISTNQWVQGGRPLAIVDGIQNLQFQYLIQEESNNGFNYRYLNAGQVQNWPNVRAITIELTAVSESNQLTLKRSVALLNTQ